MGTRDGHIRVLPLHVANKIAAGEVVERPASVVKELVENAIDAGSTNIRITVTQGGRKLVSVQDDGCGMSRDDAVMSLERQATSKILDVDDIERIDTLGFRGEAIPSIASVSRFTITTRRREADEGTRLQVNAGTIAEVCSAGCPPGTLVEVRDLFCNVPARRKFLRSYATEESHVRQIFTVHALAHPAIGFSLNVDGRELYRLASAATLLERIIDIFGGDFADDLLPLGGGKTTDDFPVHVSGFVEKPNLSTPTRREQYVFVNGRPATSSAVTYAMREAYPSRLGETRPAAIMFIELSPSQVDVNVHPTKREVRFRDNSAVKRAIMEAVDAALRRLPQGTDPVSLGTDPMPVHVLARKDPVSVGTDPKIMGTDPVSVGTDPVSVGTDPVSVGTDPKPAPLATELPIAAEGDVARPWAWFRYLAQSSSGYLLIETDQGIVTVNPTAARERIAFETLLKRSSSGNGAAEVCSQALLIPETVRLSPVDASRIRSSLPIIADMGFQIEEFGRDTFKIDAVPQIASSLSPEAVLSTIARDLAEGGSRSGGSRWREELIAKSVARSFAGAPTELTESAAVALVEDLCRCRMPYVSARGKPVMIFTSNRELDRKFGGAGM